MKVWAFLLKNITQNIFPQRFAISYVHPIIQCYKQRTVGKAPLQSIQSP